MTEGMPVRDIEEEFLWRLRATKTLLRSVQMPTVGVECIQAGVPAKTSR
jgi:hypothetical protein